MSNTLTSTRQAGSGIAEDLTANRLRTVLIISARHSNRLTRSMNIKASYTKAIRNECFSFFHLLRDVICNIGILIKTRITEKSNYDYKSGIHFLTVVVL